MRVIAGTAKSLRLLVPRGADIRPTSDAVRESLFGTLQEEILAGPFLDVYAGSGAVGIEALSRGAPRAVFVERDRRCVQAIRENLENARFTRAARVIPGDAARVAARAAREDGPFAVIFIDPPYDDRRASVVAASLLTEEALLPDGLLVVQHSRRAELLGLPAPDRVRHFGETTLTFLSLAAKEVLIRMSASAERVAVCPGSFDPITYGHVDVIARAAALFDRVIVSVAADSGKAPLFAIEERIRLATAACAHLPNVTVDHFHGLIVEHARRHGAVALVKGLRVISDFEREMQMALMNRALADGIPTLFLMTHADYAFLSSSLVKEVFLLGADISKFVPPEVEAALRERHGAGP